MKPSIATLSSPRPLVSRAYNHNPGGGGGCCVGGGQPIPVRICFLVLVITVLLWTNNNQYSPADLYNISGGTTEEKKINKDPLINSRYDVTPSYNSITNNYVDRSTFDEEDTNKHKKNNNDLTFQKDEMLLGKEEKIPTSSSLNSLNSGLVVTKPTSFTSNEFDTTTTTSGPAAASTTFTKTNSDGEGEGSSSPLTDDDDYDDDYDDTTNTIENDNDDEWVTNTTKESGFLVNDTIKTELTLDINDDEPTKKQEKDEEEEEEKEQKSNDESHNIKITNEKEAGKQADEEEIDSDTSNDYEDIEWGRSTSRDIPVKKEEIDHTAVANNSTFQEEEDLAMIKDEAMMNVLSENQQSNYLRSPSSKKSHHPAAEGNWNETVTDEDSEEVTSVSGTKTETKTTTTTSMPPIKPKMKSKKNSTKMDDFDAGNDDDDDATEKKKSKRTPSSKSYVEDAKNETASEELDATSIPEITSSFNSSKSSTKPKKSPKKGDLVIVDDNVKEKVSSKENSKKTQSSKDAKDKTTSKETEATTTISEITETIKKSATNKKKDWDAKNDADETPNEKQSNGLRIPSSISQGSIVKIEKTNEETGVNSIPGTNSNDAKQTGKSSSKKSSKVSTNKEALDITDVVESVGKTSQKKNMNLRAPSSKSNSNNANEMSQEMQGGVVPKIIWLMSFPNSGTTYTNKLVQGVSQTTTATNYGQEQSKNRTSIPISPDLPDGPYLRYPEWNHSDYVLTKTHCGGYCSRCTPSRYVLTAKQFEMECRSGNKVVQGKTSSTKPAYPADLPKKAVHILRNPMDNVVARLHMERKNWENHGNHENFLEMFQSDKAGFQKWCKFLHAEIDNANATDTDLLDDRTKELYEIVPCASEFYRYVQWHNLAIEVVEKRLKLPMHTLLYEDYSHRFNETVDQLLGFLDLEAVSDPPPFIDGKQYGDYFTEKQLYDIGLLVKHVATERTWTLLEHYFEGIFDEPDEEQD